MEVPLGHGRPGLHIECSAMASDILGDSMDIHSGGHNLQFSHHDDELAQLRRISSAINGSDMSFILSIDGLKMSKFLKNFITVKEAWTKYTARQLSMVFVIQTRKVFYNVESIKVSTSSHSSWRLVCKDHWISDNARMEGNQRPGDNDDEKQLFNRVHQRLQDNFDTAGALVELLSLVKDVHSYVDKCKSVYLMRETMKSALAVLQVKLAQLEALHLLWLRMLADGCRYVTKSEQSRVVPQGIVDWRSANRVWIYEK